MRAQLYRGAAAGLLQPEAGTLVVETGTKFGHFASVFVAAYRPAAAS